MLKAISKTMQDIVRLHQESYRDPLSPRNLARSVIFIVLWLGLIALFAS